MPHLQNTPISYEEFNFLEIFNNSINDEYEKDKDPILADIFTKIFQENGCLSENNQNTGFLRQIEIKIQKIKTLKEYYELKNKLENLLKFEISNNIVNYKPLKNRKQLTLKNITEAIITQNELSNNAKIIFNKTIVRMTQIIEDVIKIKANNNQSNPKTKIKENNTNSPLKIIKAASNINLDNLTI